MGEEPLASATQRRVVAHGNGRAASTRRNPEGTEAEACEPAADDLARRGCGEVDRAGASGAGDLGVGGRARPERVPGATFSLACLPMPSGSRASRARFSWFLTKGRIF